MLFYHIPGIHSLNYGLEAKLSIHNFGRHNVVFVESNAAGTTWVHDMVEFLDTQVSVFGMCKIAIMIDVQVKALLFDLIIFIHPINDRLILTSD